MPIFCDSTLKVKQSVFCTVIYVKFCELPMDKKVPNIQAQNHFEYSRMDGQPIEKTEFIYILLNLNLNG